MIKTIFKSFVPVLTAITLSSCSEPETFEELGEKVAGPMDITQTSTHFYVLNADIDRTYNKGSILVLDTDGNKVSATETPRMGRFAVVSGNYLIAGFGPTEQFEVLPQLKFYDISDPSNVVLKHSIEMECSPANAYAPDSYAYFAVSCVGGKIFMGTWGSSITDTTLNLVRQPDGNTRRALYIDEARNLLFAFTTDWSDPDYKDRILSDLNSYDENFNETAGENEVPDLWESSEEVKETVEKSGTELQYKFLVYDIAAEAAKGFPSLSSDSDEAKTEMRWLYFNANRSSLTFEAGQKYYRSNFWKIIAHPTDANSFYISQRGDELAGAAPDANAIYQFTITADPKPVSSVAPLTSSFLSVSAVYGHESSPANAAQTRYSGNFIIGTSGSETYFAVNDFKDKTYSRSSTYFANANYNVGFKNTAGTWTDSLTSTSRENSYFSLGAIGSRVLTGSFFTDKLILLEVSPGSDITTVTTIK